MIWDATINLGNILTLLGGSALGMVFLSSLRSDLQLASQRLAALEDQIKRLNEYVVSSVRLEAKVAAVEARLDELTRTRRIR